MYISKIVIPFAVACVGIFRLQSEPMQIINGNFILLLIGTDLNRHT